MLSLLATPGISTFGDRSLACLAQLAGHPLAPPLERGHTLLLVELYFRFGALHIARNQFLFRNLPLSQTLAPCETDTHR